MSTTTDVATLKINYLTQAQYDEAVSEGLIEENEIYMTPSHNLVPLEMAVDGLEQDVSVLEARMSSYTHLAEGSTTGDAELIDGRVGADAVTYDNIGTAIRTQIGNVDSGVSTEIDLNDHENIALYNGYVDSGGVHYADSIRLMYVPCEGNHRYKITRQYGDSKIFRVSSTTSSTIANGTDTAYNSLVLRAIANGSIQGNFNTKGLSGGTNYNGHININSSGGMVLYNNATYPLKAGDYEILAGLWE